MSARLHRARRAHAALHWVALLVVLLACDGGQEPAAGPPSQERARGRVFLIGVDGASPRVAQTLIDQGRLPTLSKIAREGASGRVRSARPLFSPRIWTSIVTGKVPKKHGIEDFQVRKPGAENRLVNSTDRRVHALWNIASARGLSVGVVNWWVTHPAERVRGVMISDHVIPAHLADAGAAPAETGDGATPAVFPPSWAPRLTDALETPGLPVAFDDFLVDNRALPHWVERDKLSLHLRTDAAAARCALLVEAELTPDLLMVFLPGTDRVSHWLWGSLEPPDLYREKLRPTPSEREAGVDALYHYYEYVDALIGRVIADATPADLVIVLSDHGIEAGTNAWRPRLSGAHYSEKALHGIFFARGPGIPPGSSSEGMSINDVTPTILAWLGLPLARDMDGRVAPFLERDTGLAPESIASYDSDPVERLEGGDDSNAAVLDQLRSLGYIE